METHFENVIETSFDTQHCHYQQVTCRIMVGHGAPGPVAELKDMANELAAFVATWWGGLGRSGAMSHYDVVVGVVLVAVVGLLYTFLWSMLMSGKVSHGSPYYNWMSCVPLQTVGFPALALYGWWSSPFTPTEWLAAGWESEGRVAERLFLFGIVGYMAKDLPAGMDRVYFAHHAVCSAMAVAFLYVPPAGVMIAGSAVLEWGSVSQTLHLFNPKSAAALYAHVAIMTLSNIGAVALALFYLTVPTSPIAVRGGFAFVVVGLSLSRQMYAHGNARAFWAAATKKLNRD